MREVSLDHRKDDYKEPFIQGVHLKDLRYAALLSTTPTGLEKNLLRNTAMKKVYFLI